MNARPITERMAEARAKMVQQRKKTPRVFFLSPDDFAQFAATYPPTIEAVFALPLGHKPRPLPCLGFDGIAVRRTTKKPDARGRINSTLYCCAGTTVAVAAQ